MGSKGGAPEHTTQTTTSEPPSWQKPYILGGLEQTEDWFNWIRRQPAYPGFSTVAPFTPYQLLGQDTMANAAYGMYPQINQYQSTGLGLLNPYSDPLMSLYAGQMPGTMGYLGSEMAGAGGAPSTYDSLTQMMTATPDMSVWGPLMQNVTDNAVTSFQEEIMPTLRTNAMMTGQYGTGSRPAIEGGLAADKLYENILQSQNQLAQTAASEALAQRTAGTSIAEQQRAAMAGEGLGAASLMTGATGDLYNRLAQSQLGALGLGGQTLGYGTLPASLFSQIGAEQQGQLQSLIGDDVSRFYANLNFPLQNLGAYQQLVTGNYGGTTSSQVPYFPQNNMMTGLGGAALGLGLNQLGSVGTGWGALGAVSPWLFPALGFASAFL